VSSDDDWFERAFDDEEADSSDETDVERDDDPMHESDANASGDTGPFAGGAGADTDADDSPFSQDFSEAFNSAPDPGTDPGEPSLSGTTPNGNPYDGADLSGFSTSEFDEAELNSQLDRIKVGIEGLDEMILGGIPTRSLIVAIGSAGTGKTTIGMQFLNTALENDERAVYISLEESRQRVLDTAEEKGWDFRRYEQEGLLAVVDLDPVEMANSLASIRNDLTRLISDFDAERLVLDSVSLLEMMYDHPARRRSEVFQFTRTLKRAGVTTLVTSEASNADPFASRYGIIEYLSDAVLVLQYVRSNNFQETRLAIEIQKIRDANHSRQPKPYEITSEGISVHQQANLF
jgi:KaiC domain protein